MVQKRIHYGVGGPDRVHQIQLIVLPKMGLILPNLQLVNEVLHVRPFPIQLRCFDHVDFPLVAANLCHDVSNIGGVHHDAVAVPLAFVEQH